MSATLNSNGVKTARVLRAFGRDGAVLGLTDYDRTIEFGGFSHNAVAGTSFGVLERSADLAPDFCSIETALCDEGIDRHSIAAGVFSEARAELWMVDVEDPVCRHLLSVGTIGELATNGDRVSLEFRSLAHSLSNIRGRIYQKSCDAALGDPRCGVDLSQPGRWATGTVLTVSGLNITIELSQGQPSEIFSLGTLEFESGELAGFAQAVRSATLRDGQLVLQLWEALPLDAGSGETVRLTVGCDKRFSTCKDQFQNTVRFRGFPHIPGVDVLTVQGRRS